MNLSYRNQKNAEATARFWGKPLEKADWYKINGLSEDEAEILIYDIIGWPFNDAAELVRALAEIKAKTITVRINSPGGDVFDGLAIFNALQSHKSKIVTRVESLAASMGSVLAMAGKEVQAYQNAMLMIHDPWAMTVGNFYDHREVADLLEKISGNILDVYAANSSIGKRELKDMLRNETWFTAKEAKDRGLVDIIIDGKAAKAQFDLSVFANAPDEILGDAEGRELTRKETERALRNAGASREYARAVAAKRAEASEVANLKAAISAMNLKNKIKGV